MPFLRISCSLYNSSNLLRCKSTTCFCQSTSKVIVTSTLRRILRLSRWIDDHSVYKVFLSSACQKPNERSSPFYTEILKSYLKTSRYAIPPDLSSCNDLQGIGFRSSQTIGFHGHITKSLREYLQRVDFSLDSNDNKGQNIVASEMFSSQPQTGTNKSSAIPISEFLGMILCSIRHLRRIQTLVEPSLFPSRCSGIGNMWTSEIEKSEYRKKIKLLPKEQFHNISKGTLLIAHPLATDIWRETIVLVTQASSSSSKIEGVIINRKPSDDDIQIPNTAADVSTIFYNALQKLLSSNSLTRLPQRIINDLSFVMHSNSSSLITRDSLLSQKALLRSLLRRHFFFGGPITSEITVLRKGVSSDSLKIIIPNTLSMGYRPSNQPSAKLRTHRARIVSHPHRRSRHSSHSLPEPASPSIKPSSLPLASSPTLQSACTSSVCVPMDGDNASPNTSSQSFPSTNYFSQSSYSSRHDSSQIKCFVGTSVWGKNQLARELQDGHWLAVNVDEPEAFNEIVWGRPGNYNWRKLLSVLSDDLYQASFLPHSSIEKALSTNDQNERQININHLLLEPILGENISKFDLVFKRIKATNDNDDSEIEYEDEISNEDEDEADEEEMPWLEEDDYEDNDDN